MCVLFQKPFVYAIFREKENARNIFGRGNERPNTQICHTHTCNTRNTFTHTRIRSHINRVETQMNKFRRICFANFFHLNISLVVYGRFFFARTILTLVLVAFSGLNFFLFLCCYFCCHFFDVCLIVFINHKEIFGFILLRIGVLFSRPATKAQFIPSLCELFQSKLLVFFSSPAGFYLEWCFFLLPVGSISFQFLCAIFGLFWWSVAWFLVQALYVRQRRNGFSSWEYYYNSIKTDWRLYNSEFSAAFLVSMAFFILPDEIENYYLALDA